MTASRSGGVILFIRRAFPEFADQWLFQCRRARNLMFRTDTTGTPTLIEGLGRASVPAVPEGTISSAPPYRAKWSRMTGAS